MTAAQSFEQRLATRAAAISNRQPMGQQIGQLQALANAFKGEGLCQAIRLAAVNGDGKGTKVQAADNIKVGELPAGLDAEATIRRHLQTVVDSYRKLRLTADVTLPNGRSIQIMVEY